MSDCKNKTSSSNVSSEAVTMIRAVLLPESLTKNL